MLITENKYQVLYGRSRRGLRLNIVGLTFAISCFSSFAIINLAFLPFFPFPFPFPFPFFWSIHTHQDSTDHHRPNSLHSSFDHRPNSLHENHSTHLLHSILPHILLHSPCESSLSFFLFLGLFFPWSEEPSSSSAFSFSFSLSFSFASSGLSTLEPSLIPCVVSVIINPENIF